MKKIFLVGIVGLVLVAAGYAALSPISSVELVLVKDSSSPVEEKTIANASDFNSIVNTIKGFFSQENAGDYEIGLNGNPTAGVDLTVDNVLRVFQSGKPACNSGKEGIMLFDTEKKHFYGCNGSIWAQLDVSECVLENGLCDESVNNGCTTGTLNDIVDADPNYLWECLGIDGGETDSCLRPMPINGECNNAIENACTAGILNDTIDDGTNYLWGCLGEYGGIDDSCSMLIPTCATPTLNSFTAPDKIYFDLNGASASSLIIYRSLDLVSWTSSTGGYSSPRTWSLMDGYHYKLRTICSSVNSGYSNIEQYNVPVNGVCDNSTENACTTGILNDTMDNGTHYLWECLGSNGGTDDTTCNKAIVFSCTGSDPANATLCSGDDTGLTSDTGKTSVALCTDLVKCEYGCNDGYHEDGGVCVVDVYVCTGSDPANATLCSGDDTGLTSDTGKTSVASCTDPVKCEYACDSGYVYEKGACYPVSYSCTGSDPINASLCSGDDTRLSGDTAKTLVNSCTDSVKCEYVCNSRCELRSGSCLCR